MPAEPPTLMAISDFAASPTHSVESWIDALVLAGVDGLQIRAKSLQDRQLEILTRRVVDAAQGRILILVNGRVDIAVATGADGVHLPSHGVSPAAIRRRFASLILGLSTHHLEEIAAARDLVDYVTFGPVFATPSKAAFMPPTGLVALSEAAAVGVPVMALGGIDAKSLAALAAAGASGIAAIRAFQDPESLVEMGSRAARLWPPK